MRLSLYRHSQNAVLARLVFSNEEMFHMAQGLEFVPKLRVSGTIGDGLLLWLEAKGNALRAVSGQESIGVIMASTIKARQVSYPMRDVPVKRVFENGRNALRMEPIPELAESFNPPRVAASKDMEVKTVPRAGATLAAQATPHVVARPARLSGEALLREEERRLAYAREKLAKAPEPATPEPVAAAPPSDEPKESPWRPPAPAPAPHINGIADLVTAIAMVNEAADRLGPDVRLFVEGNKIRAKRELRTYEDLT